MNTRETLDKVIAAFDAFDPAMIGPLLADNVEWEMVGKGKFNGKDQVCAMFQDDQGMTLNESIKKNIIVDGNKAVVNGLITYSNKEGKSMEMHYCDMYEISNGKVDKMTSYMIEPTAQQ